MSKKAWARGFMISKANDNKRNSKPCARKTAKRRKAESVSKVDELDKLLGYGL